MELRVGRDDGSGDVFVGDPTIPIASELGVELLAVNAALLDAWGELQAAHQLGLRTHITDRCSRNSLRTSGR